MLTFLLTATAVHASADILFVGNSYTMGNDLAATVQRVYADAGDSVTTAKLAAGGLTLADHATRAADTSSPWHTKLVTEADQREWVVLQDQSQIPGFPETQVQWIASRDGSIALNSLIASASAETVFFLTWGRRDGDSTNDWLYPDFSTMQSLLTAGYGVYAAACTAAERPVWTAPVGPAFAKIHDDITAAGGVPTAADSLFYALYSGDGSHPSVLGTQLAAYVFYASLTGNTPVGLSVPEGMDAERVGILQDVAAAIVFDPTDTFEFPWEAADPVDTGDAEETEDTAAETEDTAAETEDTAAETDSGGDEGAGGTGGNGGSGPASSPGPDKSSGCSALPRTGAPVMLVLLSLGLVRWRQPRA